MFNETLPPEVELSLQQRLESEITADHDGRRAAIIASAGLLAEAETLAEVLKLNGLERATASASFLSTNKILARVFVIFETKSAVFAALEAAGLHVYAEKIIPAHHRAAWERSDQLTLTLTGFDVTIVVDSIVAEPITIPEAA